MTAAIQQPELRQDVVRVDSDALGTLMVPPDRVVQFPEGVLGFPDARCFVLVAAEQDGVYWLQSIEHRALLFLVVDPFLHFPDYVVELAAADVALLRARSDDDVVILAIVTLGDGDGVCTANLQGPLALNLQQGVGRQLVLRNGDAGVRRPIRLEKASG